MDNREAVRILLVEDNPEVAANVAEGLEARGHEVDVAGDGATGLRLALRGSYDVAVLDRMLPRLDGLELCRKLRGERGRDLPVLFLTALDELEDKLAGFDAGADDYLVKPFQFAELAARVEALGRRVAPKTAPSDLLQYADLSYDTGTLEARRGTRALELNRVGHRVLQELLRSAPNVVSRERLEEILWEGFSPGGSVLRTHIYAVRKAVDGEGEVALVHTVRGMGYRIWREEA